MDSSNTILTIEQFNKADVKEIYLCNFLTQNGKLLYSLCNNIETLKFNVGTVAKDVKNFDSLIRAKIKKDRIISLELVSLPNNEVLFTLDGKVLEHFLKFPVFDYKTLEELKKTKSSPAKYKRLMANLYQYVVAKKLNS